MQAIDVGLVCLGGHEINRCAATMPHRNKKFCPQCGEQAIDKCPACDSPIRGLDRSSRFAYWRPPNHCHECGRPYPWTQRRMEALAEAIDELDGLTDEEREKLRGSVPDIVAETPRTETAALRFKKAASRVGKEGGKLLMSILSNVAAETVKKTMGL